MEDKFKCNMLFQKHSLLIELHKRKLYQKNKGKQVYIGETETSLKDRVCEHIGYINTKNKKTASR